MADSAEKPGGRRFLSPLFDRPETLPVFLFFLFFLILLAAGPDLRSSKYAVESPWLRFALDAIFIVALCLLIAGLCLRSFLRGGVLNVLLLGCGVLAFGLSSFAAGWPILPPFGQNYSATTRNLGILLTSVLYFLSALFSAFGFSMEIRARRGRIALGAYAAVILLGAVLTAETVRQSLPVFFVAGEDPAVARQVVLSVSVTLLVTSALLMTTIYVERKSRFLLFFINALLLLGGGLVGVALGAPGSPLSWLGRIAQYTGNICLAVASLQALGEARSRGTTVERALADFFRKSEAHYRTLIDMASDAIISIDHEGRILLMNPAAEKTFDFGPGEAVGHNLEERMVPGASRRRYRDCLSCGSALEAEVNLVKRSGAIFPAELSVSPDMKSEIPSARTIIIRDISERKRAEEALQQSEERLRQALEVLETTTKGTEVIVAALDTSLRYLFFNDAYREEIKRLTGRDIQVGSSMEETFAHMPEQKAIAIEQWGRTLAGESASYRIGFGDRGRYRKIYSVRHTPIRDAQGRVIGAGEVAFDITEQVRIENALRDSEERYRGLFESMNEGFALHDLICNENGEPCDYRFLDVNPAFERLTGLKRQDVIGRTVTEVLPGTEPSWITEYGKVVLTGTPAHFESHSSVLGRDYGVFAYRPAPGQFAVIFMDVTERKQAEEALRVAKELLEKRVEERTAELTAAALYARSLIEANLDALVTINAEGRITDVNRATEQATGLPRERLIGSDFSEYFTNPEAARAGYRKVFTEGQIRDYPLTMRHASGRTTDVLYHASVYRNVNGDIAGVFAAARDVTELRKAEAALKEVNESLERRVTERTEALQHAKDYAEMMIRTANVLIVGLDSTGHVQTFNDAAEKITGYTRAELHGRNWFEVVVPKDRYPHVWDEFLRIQDRSSPSEFENPILTKAGEERIISWRNNEVRLDDKRKGTISFGRDVTDSRQAEKALRDSEQRITAVVDHLPVGVWFADEKGKILYGNEAGRRIWGGARYVEPDEFHVYRAWWPETGKPLEPGDWAIARAVREGKASLNERLEIECFDGTRKTIINSAVPLKSAEGSLLGVVVLNEDITERVRAEQALREAKDGLEDKVRERTAELMLLLADLERSRGELRMLASELVLAEERERKKISVALHDEVAQTLAATKMRLDLLRTMPGSEEIRHVVSEAQELIGQSIRQTRALMTDITNPVLYDMGLPAAVEALVQNANERHGISFSCIFSGNLRNLGQDMEVMIFQVVKELVQNIIKHSAAGKACIRIDEERGDIRVAVADDGLGFDVGIVGTVGLDGGFGLFSIRERVKFYNGVIKIESEPGKGTEVIVLLPKKTAGAAASRKTGNRKGRS